MSYYVTDDLFNKVEGMSKAQILALFENANYTPSFYAGALDNGVSYLYTGIKPTDALLTAILEHGLGNHTLTDLELDAINANVFSVLFIDAKTVAAKSDGSKLYINVVGETISELSSSSRIIKLYPTEADIKEGKIVAGKASNAVNNADGSFSKLQFTAAGVLKIDNVIVPCKKLLYSNEIYLNTSASSNTSIFTDSAYLQNRTFELVTRNNGKIRFKAYESNIYIPIVDHEGLCSLHIYLSDKSMAGKLIRIDGGESTKGVHIKAIYEIME